MAYEKTVWVDGTTKLNAENLNHIETGLEEVSNNVDTLSSSIAEYKVNTGAFDPTSDNPAGQKSTAEALVDKNTYYANAMIGRFAGGVIGPYQSGRISIIFSDWSSYTDMSNIFAGASIYGDPPVVLDMGNLNNTMPFGVDLESAFARVAFYNAWTDKLAESKIIFGNGRIYLHFSFMHCKADKILVKDGATCKIVNDCRDGFNRTQCEEIGAFDLSECLGLFHVFEGNSRLKLLHFKNIPVSFDISYSTNFTESALVEIIGNLVDLTGKPSQTLTMGATNLAKLTDAEKAVATAKNWTLA